MRMSKQWQNCHLWINYSFKQKKTSEKDVDISKNEALIRGVEKCSIFLYKSAIKLDEKLV